MRPIGESEEPQVMSQLVLELLCLLIRVSKVRQHNQITSGIKREGQVLNHRDQVIKVISQRLAILDDHIPILAVREVVLAQIGSCYQHMVVKYMNLDVVDAPDFSKWTVGAFALEKADIRVVVETHPDVSTKLILLDLGHQLSRTSPVSVDPGASHVVEDHGHSQLPVVLNLPI